LYSVEDIFGLGGGSIEPCGASEIGETAGFKLIFFIFSYRILRI
jgi:hypothetical protein